MSHSTSRPVASSGWRHDGPRYALVWWVIATLALIAAVAGAAAIVAVGATVRAAIGGERSQAVFSEVAQEALGSTAFVWITVIVSQLALLACAWFACRVLGKPARERLGLVATDVGRMQGAVLLVATVVPFALGLVAAWLVSTALGSSSEDALGLQRMWREGSRAESVAWILLIALLPGFVEEVFYRGFLQRGLLLRWGPAASIFTSSLLFAAVHGELAWAAAILPLGVWLGVVAWRTGSVLMTFAMHAGINGLWTAGMMILHRDPTSEPLLNGIAIAMLALGAIAFPSALAILRRPLPLATGAVESRPRSLLPRVAGAAVVAGALCFVIIPPGTTPTTPEPADTSGTPATATAPATSPTPTPTPTSVPAPASASTTPAPTPTSPPAPPPPTPPAPTLAELDASVKSSVTCTAIGEEGAVEFSLMPGEGARVALPGNRVGIDEVIVTLDAVNETVWLAYAGERSGKGAGRRPVGIVEQLASGDPTVLCMTLTPGPPPVTARLTLEEDEAKKLAAFERAADGWSTRGRK